MIKKSIPFIVFLVTDIYFIISAMIGYIYYGSESSMSYTIFNIFLFILASAYFFFDLFSNKNSLKIKDILVLIASIVPIFLFLISLSFEGVSPLAYQRFMFYILWGISSALMGVYLSKRQRYKQIINYLDIFLWMVNIALVRTLSTSLIENVRVGVGGETYQKAGYLFALAFGINLFLLKYGNEYERNKIFASKFFISLNYIFLVIQFVGVLASGARGSMILLIAYSIIFLLFQKFTISVIIKTVLIITLSTIIFIIFLPTLEEIPLFNQSFGRLFEYITLDGINWEGTSGRDILYKEAIGYIFKSPLIGYGFFNYLSVIGFTAHNIFLEILLQGGILYLLISLVVFILLGIKLINMIKLDKFILPYFVLFMYPLITLMFSGIYYNNSYFCFFITFIVCYTINEKGEGEKIGKTF